MRCFVAVDLSPAVREALARAQAELQRGAPRADVRWVDVAGSHLTLKFLGSVVEGRRAELAAALGEAAAGHRAIEVAAAGLGGFPSARRPRVVWAGITVGGAPLTDLAAAVERVVAPLGFPSEARPFAPHVTLGRVRSPRALDRLAAALLAGAGDAFGTWTVREVTLLRSHLRPSGAVYEALERVPLAAP